MDHLGFIGIDSWNPIETPGDMETQSTVPWTDPQEGRMSAEYKADSRG